MRIGKSSEQQALPKKGGVTPPLCAILVGVQIDSAAAMQHRNVGPPADNAQVRQPCSFFVLQNRKDCFAF